MFNDFGFFNFDELTKCVHINCVAEDNFALTMF